MSERHEHIPATGTGSNQTPLTEQNTRTLKKHLIKTTWLRRCVKTSGVLICFILLLPVLVYVPFVQDWLKDAACYFASRSTGMKIHVDKFRLGFPLDVKLDGVFVLTQTGDTMVQAQSLIADVKILPLLHLDAQINRACLLDAKYTMVSADSSMTMKLRAGELQFEHGSDINLKNSLIKLHNPILKNADIDLQINVWKQKPDSVSSPTEWIITADKLQLHNVRFHMSMLPTIKNLDINIGTGLFTDALIDLPHYNIHASSVTIDRGQAQYIVPTTQYIASHPVPTDTISPPSPPFTIKIDNTTLNFDKAIYATDKAKPMPGFDPSYIEVSGLSIAVKDFYNQASTLSLPFTRLKATERSGLSIAKGSGTVDIDSIGIQLHNLDITTDNSQLQCDADIPYALMELKPDAPVRVNASGSLGWSDLYAFMPALQQTLKYLPNRDPLVFDANIGGTISSLHIAALDVSIKRFLQLKASGNIFNPLNINTLKASVTIDGSLTDSGVLNRWFGSALKSIGVTIPAFRIKGHVDADKHNYNARVSLTSDAGDASVNGYLRLNSEQYNADLSFDNFDLGVIMPALGVGVISGNVHATGAGFNPMKQSASSKIDADFQTLIYNSTDFAPITLHTTVNNGAYDLVLNADNPNINATIAATGHMKANMLTTDLQADIRHLDLHKLGFMDTKCAGSATFNIQGSADIYSYYCDLYASLDNIDWTYADSRYSIPESVEAALLSEADTTHINLYSDSFSASLQAHSSLKSLLSTLPNVSTGVTDQISKRHLDMNILSDLLPEFQLNLTMADSGLPSRFIADSGYKFNTLDMQLQNDSTISGNLHILQAGTKSLTLDTINLHLRQREQMLDYNLHIGNTADNLPEFADINLSGYLGTNRIAAFLRQRNIRGEEGYRLGMTAAMMDSTVNVHLTPLNATIAYKPWKVNDDNFILIGPGSRVQADLTASSGASSIRLSTPERPDSLQSLQVQISNVHIEDFLQMDVLAPPVTGTVNSDLTLVYRGKGITGTGNIGIKQLAYDKQNIGDILFDVKAGMGFSGNSGGKIDMLLNGKEVMNIRGYMLTDSTTIAQRTDNTPTAFILDLKDFPLSTANPFLSQEYMQLTGAINGSLKMTGSLTSPILNGNIKCLEAGIRIPAAGATIHLDDKIPVTVDNNLLRFSDFKISAANDNPLTLNGYVDASSLSDMAIDLSLAGKDVALINNRRTSDDIYGKLFIDLDASAKGPLNHLDINADLSILPSTDIYYTMASAATSIQNGNTTDVVKFVQFSDSTTVVKPDSVLTPPMNMRINASLNIITGAKATVNLSTNGTDKVTLSPYGSLSYTQNFMGDMRLNGSVYLGEGFVRYSIPLIGEKSFTFDDNSYVNWSGDLMNPALHITATDRLKANVQQDGVNSHLIYFNVTLAVAGHLSAPKVTFDLSTDDDLTVSNELQSMSADQRQAAAMNLLLTNTYTGPGVKANANLSNPLYSFLEGQLNSWAAKTIKGVDLSFGIDNYKQTVDGQKNNTTSYSYQVSKSLFDNRFKIIVGGNYSTDEQADENFAQNLISDISFEYALKQSANFNMYLRLFRHTGFESILEGEVTETGVGFVMRRKLPSFRSLFNFLHRKHGNTPNDTLTSILLSTDSTVNTNHTVSE